MASAPAITRAVALLDRRTWLGAAYVIATALMTALGLIAVAVSIVPWLAAVLTALLMTALLQVAGRPVAGRVSRRLRVIRAGLVRVSTLWAPIVNTARATADLDRRLADGVLGSSSGPVATSALRETVVLLLLLPLTVACAAAMVVLSIAMIILLSLPLWAGPGEQLDFAALGSVPIGTPSRQWIGVAIGIGSVVVLAPVVRWIGLTRARLARRLLDPPQSNEEIAALTARVNSLREEHSAAVRVNSADHRRIERDLHDGAQVRLTSLILELGRARRKMDTDPAAARALVEDAYQQAQQTLTDIRHLARGIQPPILADRGLDAAVSALTPHASVPVSIDIDIAERLPAPIESAAYFIVAEALSNITKHAAARHAWVCVRHIDGRCVVEVGDDGRGGADTGHGGGLAGLADRALALGGRLTVHSPAGGGTTIRAELPCGW